MGVCVCEGVRVVPSMERRACGLETDISSWRVSHIHFSETRVDGLMVAMTFSAVSGAILTLSVSSLCLSVPVVVSLSLSLSLTHAHTHTHGGNQGGQSGV